MPGPISDSYEGPDDGLPEQIAKEDRKALCWHGLMGHNFIGMYGQQGKRACRCEANDLQRAIAAFYSKDPMKSVYQRTGKKTWKLIWVEGGAA